MRKMFILSLLMLFSLAVWLTSCESKKKKQQEVEKTEEVVKQDTIAELVVENTISSDREYMFLNYGDNYRWYETCILLADYLDADEQDGKVEGVSNVFQYLTVVDSTSFDVNVVISAYAKDKYTYEVHPGLWVGDSPLNEENIALTFEEAYERVMAANYVKPHSRNCVLRREVGPAPNVAPQYVFGNQRSQLYVNATTGEVRDTNPAFEGFEKPLGEWP